MTFKAYLATVFCLVALCSTASANEITLSSSSSQECPTYDCEYYNPVFLLDAASSPGEHSEGWGSILQFTGPDGQSDPISGGNLSFWTAPSYDAQSFQPSPISLAVWGDAGTGGGFSVSGSVFGFGPGTLLSGTFLSASWNTYDFGGGIDGSEFFDSAIQANYVNPVLLEGFGLQPHFHFVGSLTGSYDYDWWGMSGSSQVGIDLVATPTPEPSAVVLASLFLLVSGLAYLRRLRTRNCG